MLSAKKGGSNLQLKNVEKIGFVRSYRSLCSRDVLVYCCIPKIKLVDGDIMHRIFDFGIIKPNGLDTVNQGATTV